MGLVDVDRFKLINDRFSHGVGDKVLVCIAGAMRSVIREADVATRLAGDEFVSVMPGADIRTAQLLRRRLQNAVAAVTWNEVAEGLASVSVSVGIAQARAGDSPETLLEAADREMYVDKRARQSGEPGSEAVH